MYLKIFLVFIVVVFLMVCSSFNIVNVIVGEGIIILLKIEGDYEGCFYNLYFGDKEYLIICIDNCYELLELFICDDSNL